MAKTSTAVKPKFGTRDFWKSFAKTHWEKSPVVFNNISGDVSEIKAADIFRLLVLYCDRARKLDSLDGLKFYVDGVRLEVFEAIELLPVAEDKSLVGYNRRMEKQFRDYGLVCDKLMDVMQGPEEKIRSSIFGFMNGLYESSGVPNRFSEIGLYLGNYRKTPFGVHVDKCGVISLPVVGKKKFRLWTPEFVEQHPELKESFQYDEFKKQSKILSCETGDIAYWPSSHWHIAESDGKFSATWSIGIWVDQTTTDLATKLVTAHIEKTIRKSLGKKASKTSHTPGKMPKELREAAKALGSMSKNEIRQIFEAWWHDHSRHSAFKTSKD